MSRKSRTILRYGRGRTILSVRYDPCVGSFSAEVKGVTCHQGWAAAHRDCPLEACHAALCNALCWWGYDARHPAPRTIRPKPRAKAARR